MDASAVLFAILVRLDQFILILFENLQPLRVREQCQVVELDVIRVDDVVLLPLLNGQLILESAILSFLLSFNSLSFETFLDLLEEDWDQQVPVLVNLLLYVFDSIKQESLVLKDLCFGDLKGIAGLLEQDSVVLELRI